MYGNTKLAIVQILSILDVYKKKNQTTSYPENEDS